MVEDEVKKAWEALRKTKKGKAEEVQDKRAQVQREEEAEKTEEEETLENSLAPEEKEEFSVLPGKAPSLEITGATQNLESTIGPFFGGEEENEEKVSYTTKKKQKDYFGGSGEEQEKKYERPVIESAVELAAPQMFRESDIAQMARMAAPKPEKMSAEREYVSMENVEVKELEHEKLTRERRETVKKYKPQM